MRIDVVMGGVRRRLVEMDGRWHHREWVVCGGELGGCRHVRVGEISCTAIMRAYDRSKR